MKLDILVDILYDSIYMVDLHLDEQGKELLRNLKDSFEKWHEASLGARTFMFLFLPLALNLLSRRYFIKALNNLET